MSVLSGHPVAGENRVVPEFEAAYKVRASVASGHMSMSFTAAEDGTYLFKTHTKPRGLVRVFARGEINESSRLTFVGGSVRPLDYTLRDTISEGKDADYEYDWAAGRLTGVERGKTVSVSLSPGMLNRAAMYIALMQDLASNRLPEEYVLFDRGRVKIYGLHTDAVETIRVPYGSFETVKLVRDTKNSRRAMHMWCAPELGFLPIRIDLYKDEKRISRAELKAVLGLPPTSVEAAEATSS